MRFRKYLADIEHGRNDKLIKNICDTEQTLNMTKFAIRNFLFSTRVDFFVVISSCVVYVCVKNRD